MKKLLIPIVLLALFGCTPTPPFVQINDTTIEVEIADTSELRHEGLMYREHLGENNGMLFTYDRPGKHPFWMKNTLIPLDMIWINKDLEIVHIETATPCPSESKCPYYTPPVQAIYVLEVNGGYAEENKINVGDKATIELE